MVVARGATAEATHVITTSNTYTRTAAQQQQTDTERTPTEPLELFCCELSSKDLTLLNSIFDPTMTPVYTVHSSFTIPPLGPSGYQRLQSSHPSSVSTSLNNLRGHATYFLNTAPTNTAHSTPSRLRNTYVFGSIRFPSRTAAVFISASSLEHVIDDDRGT